MAGPTGLSNSGAAAAQQAAVVVVSVVPRPPTTVPFTQMLSSVYPDTLSGIRVPNGMLNGRLLFAGIDAAHRRI